MVTPKYQHQTKNTMKTTNSHTQSVVLQKTKHLLDLKYTGKTPGIYIGYISDFLDFTKNVPDRVNNEDILNYNIHIKDWHYSKRNVAISAIKAYFRLYLRKKIKGFSVIRPKHQTKVPTVYDAFLVSLKINAIENLKHKAILALGLSCWLRNSEVKNLKIKDIDGKRMRILIRQSKGAKDREVKLSQNTLQILRAYFLEYNPKAYLFNGQTKPQYSNTSINKLANLYLGFKFHSLRASGATHAVKMGTDIKTVSQMLGHSKIETTKHYIPVLLENVNQVI